MDLSFSTLNHEATDSQVITAQKIGVSLRACVAAAATFSGGGGGFAGQEYDTDANAPTFDTDASATVKDTDT